MKTLQMSYKPMPIRPQYMGKLINNKVKCPNRGNHNTSIKSCTGCANLKKINFATIDCNHE